MAKVIQVIDTYRHEGRGTEDDPHRLVRQFYSLDGELLIEHDETKVVRDAKYSRDIYAATVTLQDALKAQRGIEVAVTALRQTLEGRHRDA